MQNNCKISAIEVRLEPPPLMYTAGLLVCATDTWSMYHGLCATSPLRPPTDDGVTPAYAPAPAGPGTPERRSTRCVCPV
ncbi:hypothetical protein EVAR_67236_1 [Eumeta japonica]|uniref:Uncharacterized protein n=1 Tax=Eumeta variegata TaxID=151549 RepID=A0A4C1YUA2_EUMVA|nr:hypothetical protein EVAR_67236_1 [Eumeta japonica]